MPSLPVISLSAEAISSACARLSSAQGPAIRANGRSLPKRTLPTATVALGFGSTRMVTTAPCAAHHGEPVHAGQCVGAGQIPATSDRLKAMRRIFKLLFAGSTAALLTTAAYADSLGVVF